MRAEITLLGEQHTLVAMCAVRRDSDGRETPVPMRLEMRADAPVLVLDMAPAVEAAKRYRASGRRR